jgi:hypothetical protein
MAYRNGTYIAFHAGGSTDPTASDIRYYRLMKAWHEHDDIEFSFINSHEKVAGVKDSSKKDTLRRSLLERLANSKNMVLIIGPTTKTDTDWVPFEIARAVDNYGLPIIAVYTRYDWVLNPSDLSALWPSALFERIASGKAHVIHIPFKQVLIDMAIRQFDLNNMPQSSLTHYTRQTYEKAGIQIR